MAFSLNMAIVIVKDHQYMPHDKCKEKHKFIGEWQICLFLLLISGVRSLSTKNRDSVLQRHSLDRRSLEEVIGGSVVH